MNELLIKNGKVVDGTGTPAFRGIVHINKVRIQGVYRDGEDLPATTETIDATGLVVAPGFIDMHFHLTSPLNGLSKTIFLG